MSCGDALGAALAYAARGWPVVPFVDRDGRKYPLTPHGKDDATLDRLQIEEWWRRWPGALPSIVTGSPSGVVALDVDVRAHGSGVDTLDHLEIAFHLRTPTAHTPRGGFHMLFMHPGYDVPCSAGKLGPYLDVRGDGGSLILPPGPGRSWDPHLGSDTVLAPMPDWLCAREAIAQTIRAIARPIRQTQLDRYGEAALDSAVRRIVEAPEGEQHTTLNRECFAIAGLVASGALPAALALESIEWGASQMASHDRRRPWRREDIRRQVRDAFYDGLAHPRNIPR